MAIQNINNYRRGKQPVNPAVRSGVQLRSATPQRTNQIMPTARQVLEQGAQNVNRNIQTANPVTLGGALLYTSQYGDEVLADAKKRAEKGDLISQLYVDANTALIKPAQARIEDNTGKGNLLLDFTTYAVNTLPMTLATIPAALQSINLLQRGDSGIIKKGYQEVPGIVTDTIDLAKTNPAGLAGAVAGGAILGGGGLAGTTKAGRVGKAAKTPTPTPSAKPKTAPKQIGGNRKTTQNAFSPNPSSQLRRQNISRTVQTTKSTAKNSVAKTTPGGVKTQQRSVIRGNVPSEIRGTLAPGVAGEVKIRGNTFTIKPIEQSNTIDINTRAPGTIRPMSFDDVVQNLVRNQNIAVKRSDRRATVTSSATMQRMPVGATLEPGGVRARFPDYSPNIYRPISSEDYFASAIGRGPNPDIYTMPLRQRSEFNPPKSIQALNTNSLFRLLEKTQNPAPLRPQNLNSFSNNPRVKQIELVEVGQESKPRALPANIQPLRISRITEYVAEFEKISFINQRPKTRRASGNRAESQTKSSSGFSSSGKSLSRSIDRGAETPVNISLPASQINTVSRMVVTPSVSVSASLSAIPATISKVIPGDIPSDNDSTADTPSDSSTDSSGVVSRPSDSTSGDVSSSIPRPIPDITFDIPRVRDGSARTSRRVNRSVTRTRDTDTESLRRIRDRDVDTIKTQKTRKKRDTDAEEEEEKKKKSKKRTVNRTYKQRVNPLPWLDDPEDLSWTRKDLTFMRMPANVRRTETRPLLEKYNSLVKDYNAARKKLRNTATQKTAGGKKALSTLKSLYKSAIEAREQAQKAIQKNRR